MLGSSSTLSLSTNSSEALQRHKYTKPPIFRLPPEGTSTLHPRRLNCKIASNRPHLPLDAKIRTHRASVMQDQNLPTLLEACLSKRQSKQLSRPKHNGRCKTRCGRAPTSPPQVAAVIERTTRRLTQVTSSTTLQNMRHRTGPWRVSVSSIQLSHTDATGPQQRLFLSTETTIMIIIMPRPTHLTRHSKEITAEELLTTQITEACLLCLSSVLRPLDIPSTRPRVVAHSETNLLPVDLEAVSPN